MFGHLHSLGQLHQNSLELFESNFLLEPSCLVEEFCQDCLVEVEAKVSAEARELTLVHVFIYAVLSKRHVFLKVLALVELVDVVYHLV